LTVLLTKASELITRCVEEADSGFEPLEEEYENLGENEWVLQHYLSALDQVGLLEEDLENLNIGDPTEMMEYEQYFLSWQKKGKSAVEPATIFEATSLNWIASKAGQRFFDNIIQAVDLAVDGLLSDLSLYLDQQKSKISITIESEAYFDAGISGNREVIKNHKFLCPLTPTGLKKVFEHLGFTVRLISNNNPFVLKIKW